MEKTKYDLCPTLEGVRYIIRSKCCLDKLYTVKVICANCKKENCEFVTFYERTEVKPFKNKVLSIMTEESKKRCMEEFGAVSVKHAGYHFTLNSVEQEEMGKEWYAVGKTYNNEVITYSEVHEDTNIANGHL